jgi:hypothetical protein
LPFNSRLSLATRATSSSRFFSRWLWCEALAEYHPLDCAIDPDLPTPPRPKEGQRGAGILR